MIKKDEWSPNSPDLNPLDYHVWGAMLELYQRYIPKQKTIEELKDVLKQIWTKFPRNKLTNPSSHSQRDFMRVFEKTVAILNILSKE